jgi:predicted DNA binding CopG/RHH family protein
MKTKFPDFKTDEEAERFVEKADLSAYDFSDMVPVRFELKPKDRTVSLRLPGSLLSEVKTRADAAGMPYQRFMRLAIERALRDTKPK